MNIKINTEKIKGIKLGDSNYPEKLKNIYDPPRKLYVIGNEQILNRKSIPIVGCRNCSDYGKKYAFEFAGELAKKDIVIISGFARGIDTCAHRATVCYGRSTIAVLGCGLDIVYPEENLELYKRILQTGGAIVSEYPIGTPPLKQNFPKRNRIISGLSDGVFVIEAMKRSGTMITVEHALEQGKDIFALPRKYLKSSIRRNK